MLSGEAKGVDVLEEKSGAVTAAQRPTRVFIIDDSPMMCKVLQKVLSEDTAIEVVGRALNGQEALERLSDLECDVCTLDVHMPGMNGLTVLKHIMIRRPIPTLMVSAFTADGSRVTFEALRYGAVDFFQKPSRDGGEDMLALSDMLRSRVKRAAKVQVGAARYLRLRPVSGDKPAVSSGSPEGIAVVNTSTGGYSSILAILPNMQAPPKVPVVVSMGTPGRYLTAFVDYLKGYVPCELKRAGDQDLLQPGTIYFTSAEESVSLERAGDGTRLLVNPRPDLTDEEGGVDLLLFSSLEHFGKDVLVMTLSGDRKEGLTGAREAARLGAPVLVQRPESCLAPTQPRRIAEEVGAQALSLGEIAAKLTHWSKSD